MSSLRCHAALALLALCAWAPPTLAAAEEAESWVRYFPDRPAAPADEAGWAELARAFPNRVKPAAASSSSALQSPPATRTEIRPGIDYVRVRRLASDLHAIEEALTRDRLVIDLRYVRGELEEALQLGALLARRPVVLEAGKAAVEPKGVRAGGQRTLCLINRATAGPLEAVLDALQSAGDVLLVGTQSAGDTGNFVPVATAPSWRVIAEDFRRSNGSSLLDVGVTPGLFVETTPDTEDAAYLALDAGRPAGELLDAPVQKARFDEAKLQQHFSETRNGSGGGRVPVERSSAGANKDGTAKEGDAAATDPTPFDRSLHRAVSTLIAFDVLHPSGLAPKVGLQPATTSQDP